MKKKYKPGVPHTVQDFTDTLGLRRRYRRVTHDELVCLRKEGAFFEGPFCEHSGALYTESKPCSDPVAYGVLANGEIVFCETNAAAVELQDTGKSFCVDEAVLARLTDGKINRMSFFRRADVEGENGVLPAGFVEVIIVKR